MRLKSFSILASAALVLVGTSLGFAQDEFVVPDSPEDIVAVRQALMKEDGGILRQAGELSGAEAVAAMQTVITNYSHIPALFPEGSIVGDSGALPVIWEDFDAFTAIVDTGTEAAKTAMAAAEAGDGTAYGAALKALGGSCGACHQQFRQPQ
ncbi:cytochrome c [Devosia rhodophyticola]|uniref:Cytochrome c n=1 Tax=Devosia rhodophyticola TaxID=3026423 RepID=A0ABY7YYA0_9HYPH|nr:cytochrome c [Devosia rhodophyticola]WDR06344.1 cytochrome c [Devosia rhodophyticola]